MNAPRLATPARPLRFAADVGHGAISADAPRGKSAWFVVVVASGACLAVSLASGTHVGFALVTIPIAVALVWQSPKTALMVLPVWMVMLGLVRRLTPGGGNVTLSGDPVLIIGPIVIFLLFCTAQGRGAFQERTRFSTLVASFAALAFLEAFNPKQGSLLTGLSGLLFVFVPVIAFFIGRALLDEALGVLIIKMVALLSLVSALYGLIQQFHGLPSWDAHWTQTKGYAALSIGSGVLRAFGPFSSAEEYAAFLSIGLVAWIVLALSRSADRMFPPLYLIGAGTVAIALWFESERTAVFLAALALGVVFAARLRFRPYGVLLAGVAAVVGLIVFAGHLGHGSASSGSAASQLSNHVAEGVGGPFSAGSSLPGHIRATRIGILQAFKNPFGHGTGVITPSASRYGKAKTVGTEFDPGNMGIAFGVPGLVLYGGIVWQAIKTTYRAAVIHRDVISMFGLGVIMATLFQWTNGDLYSVCWLIWLFLGYLDLKMRRTDPALLVPEPVSAVSTPAHVWRRPSEPRRDIAIS